MSRLLVFAYGVIAYSVFFVTYLDRVFDGGELNPMEPENVSCDSFKAQ